MSLSEAFDQVVRASSEVECFNSSLRPYVSVKKHLSKGFLALIALYHNTRPLPQRGNKTPVLRQNLVTIDIVDFLQPSATLYRYEGITILAVWLFQSLTQLSMQFGS